MCPSSHSSSQHAGARRTRRLLLAALGGLALVAAERGAGASWAAGARFRRVTKSFTNGTQILIPEAGPASPWPSKIKVSGFRRGELVDIDVVLHGVNHTFPGDIDILLEAPGGKRAIIFSDVGQGNDLVNHTIRLDDEAGAPPPQFAAFASGAYRPVNYFETNDDQVLQSQNGPGLTRKVKLSTFDGIDPNGTWKLWVGDEAAAVSGNIARGWELIIKARVPR